MKLILQITIAILLATYLISTTAKIINREHKIETFARHLENTQNYSHSQAMDLARFLSRYDDKD